MPETRPNTLIIGAMKASTTLLYTMLGRHPHVWFPDDKEPHYFTAPDYAEPEAWQRYLALFKGCPADARIIAEASTNYSKLSHFGDTPARIREKLGEPKLVYILRDPVARAVSNFRHSFVTRQYPAGMTAERAFEEDPILLTASRYAHQLDAYHSEFGDGSVHVMVAERLHEDPAGEMARLAAYLGIDAIEDWATTPDAVNAIGQLAAADRADRLLGPSLRRKVSAFLPRGVKEKLKNAASSDVAVPDVAHETRDRVFAAVADDLTRLHTMLGEAIEIWPSTQRLLGAEPERNHPAA